MSLLSMLDTGIDDAPALLDCDGASISHADLRASVGATAARLRELGLGPADAAAIVLPNGPELATSFLAAATAGVSAPLNPAYRRDELEFYLDDLDARLLLIGDLESPARDVARARGIPIVEVRRGAAPGLLTLAGAGPPAAKAPEAGAQAMALVLHTSGTTARPKRVPLSHANLSASAHHIAQTLALTRADRCLNVMPLFHIHGLVGALLASLSAGASVVCTPGFFAPSFYEWLASSRCTWYTAVPTMHQAIAARSGEPAAKVARAVGALRFVRSSSAALPRRTLEELEAAFGVPVIEAYGMTEASHQMASNPLPPGVRKPGSVGPAAGPEVAIMGADGALLAAGQRGEVVIRGPNVTAGYLADPVANRAAFHDGWLRTGDEGSLDEHGYLTLTGRLKEMINRGGEKVAPLEVDEVLMTHPAVAQALAFALPHPLLGEDVAAAVVVRAGAEIDERALREHVARCLAWFKVPRRVVIVSSIPLGPSGKPQRLGLAARLGLSADVPVDDADTTDVSTPTEEVVAMVWQEVLGSAPPGTRRNFFALGGDSITAMRMVARLRELLAVEIALLGFFDAPTVAGVAALIDSRLEDEVGHDG